MIKICILIQRYFTFGGRQKIATDIANFLSKNSDYKITICTLDKKKIYYNLNHNIKIDYKNDVSRNIIQRLLGYCIYKGFIKTNNIKVLKSIYFSKKQVKKLNTYLCDNRFDVVIGIATELTMLLCMTDFNCKKIGWQHVDYNGYFRTKGIYNYGIETLAKHLYKNLDVNIVLSKEDKIKYKQFMNITSTIIHNPLTIQPIITEELYSSNLIFVGRLARYEKGLDYLVEILQRLFKYNRHFKCFILGDGIDKDYLIKELKLRGLINNVELVGETQDVVSYYARSSILLSTSRLEGFGLVYIEAMSCGVIPISFENVGSKEIIDNNIDGYIINNFDINKYVETLNNLLHDNKKREELSLKAIEKSKKFDVNTILEQWNKILK